MNRTLARVRAIALGALISMATLLPISAQAGIDDAFDNLLASSTNASVSEPGQYSSQARHTFVGGGVDIRFPSKQAPQLYSVTPIQLNAGCGGISVYFGGFSFISGEEIKQMIQAVAQNSVGVAVELVMTTLCGPCAHVMQVMRSLAKDAANRAIDSCEIARSLMERGRTVLFGADTTRDDKDKALCAGSVVNSNDDEDWISATTHGLCENATKAIANLEEQLRQKMSELNIEIDSPQGQATLCNNGGRCNTVWTLLNQTDLAENSDDNVRAKVLLMNVIGTNVKCGGNEDCKAAMGEGVSSADGVIRGTDVVTFPPRLGNVVGSNDKVDMQDVFSLYMCGTDWSSAGATLGAQQVIDQYCAVPAAREGQRADIAKRWIWDCADLVNDKACLTLVKRENGASSLAGTGYLPKVVNLMQKGIDSIRRNEEMDPDVIRLIQITPVPLYQAINAAAVYPDAGAQLVAVMGTYVAQLMTYADLRDVIRNAERMEKSIGLDSEGLDRMYAFLGGMRATTEKAQLQLGQAFTMHQALMEQIRMINLAMQREVMSTELLGPAQLGTAVNDAAQQAVGTR